MFLGLGQRRNVAAEMGLNLDVILSLQPTLKSRAVVVDLFSHIWSSLPRHGHNAPSSGLYISGFLAQNVLSSLHGYQDLGFPILFLPVGSIRQMSSAPKCPIPTKLLNLSLHSTVMVDLFFLALRSSFVRVLCCTILFGALSTHFLYCRAKW